MVLSPIGHLALPPHLAEGRQGDAVFGGTPWKDPSTTTQIPSNGLLEFTSPQTSLPSALRTG
jgi:hypothetical protein